MSAYDTVAVTLAGPTSQTLSTTTGELSPLKGVTVEGPATLAGVVAGKGSPTALATNWTVDEPNDHTILCNATSTEAKAQELLDSVRLAWPERKVGEDTEVRLDVVANKLGDAPTDTWHATCADGSPFVFSVSKSATGTGGAVLSRLNRDTGDSTTANVTGLTANTAINRLVGVSESTVLFVSTNASGDVALLQASMAGGAVTTLTTDNIEVTDAGGMSVSSKVAVFLPSDATSNYLVVSMSDTSQFASRSFGSNGVRGLTSTFDNVYIYYTTSATVVNTSYIAVINGVAEGDVTILTRGAVQVAGSGRKLCAVIGSTIYYCSSVGGGFVVTATSLLGDEKLPWDTLYNFPPTIGMYLQLCAWSS